ncbi:hypothetical protein [Promicromonospora iranensis]|uniref:LytR cell envelope-related transcriptional attenuator n=1 Tax=Promicromonospora iranensis TaxID=1105144 RepID=A0ABU2CUW5_9MICO|nr:hypothetical protein [Promicromonospora iranensis]MDR7384932.1 hypothetical protein [Promicromonospora iranensis]
MPHLATARRTAALAAAVGLALATGGCGTEAGPGASATTTESTPEPRAAVSSGPAELPTFDPSSAVATYAEGFPTELFPMPKGAILLASSASPVPAPKGAKGSAGSKGKGVPMTQVTLNLASSLPAKKVVAQAKHILVEQGFKQIPAAESSGLTAQTAFLRVSRTKSGEVQESLVVGVLDDGERRLVSISGTVRTP